MTSWPSTMSYSKQSSVGGAPLYSPPQSTLISSGSANYAHQTPSTDNSSGLQYPGAVVPINRGGEYGAEDCINDICKLCKDAQGRVQALSQAIGRQPGMPGSLTDLLNNDLRVIAQQFITTTYYCRMLEKKIDERTRIIFQERASERASHDAELNNYRHQLQTSCNRISKLEQNIREIEQSYANVEKRRKVELEKKKEKIDNQKRRIKEQQDQIDSLKKKAIDGSKAAKSSRTKSYDGSSPEPEFPHSATSELEAGRKSPPIPKPGPSTLDGKDEEFLLNNLKKLDMDFVPSGHPFPPPPSGAMNMERDNFMHHGVAPPPPPPPPYGHFGQHMPPMGPMGFMGSMNGALAPYGAFPPTNPYAPPAPNFGRPPMPPNGQAPSYHGYHSPGYQGPSKYTRSRSTSHSARGSESHQSSALVLRRNDDSEFDPETKIWKDMFFRLFTSVNGWSHSFCAKITPGAVEEATKNNPKLWDYILKVATCYKDSHAAPKHALFMLNSPDHRAHFISRLMLQYIEQEMLHYKFWLGWDEETDGEIKKLEQTIDFIGYPLEKRRSARQELRSIVEGIVKDDDYKRFRTFKTGEHARRLKDIVGPFLSTDAGTDASLGLHSIANIAMEISNKMMTSRLSFTFTWNECAVKYSHDSHIALNNELHGLSLQHKHIRVCLVVTPSISYRDDSGVSIVPRGVTKAQVLVMN